MKTLKIEIPEGFEIESFDTETGDVKLKEKQKPAIERIKTIEDVLSDNNTTQSDIDLMFANTPEHLKHQYITELLCKSLNEEWIPDWDNSNQYKYFPWFTMSPSGFLLHGVAHWHSISYVGSRLCFKSRDLAEYAAEQFTDLYKSFMLTK